MSRSSRKKRDRRSLTWRATLALLLWSGALTGCAHKYVNHTEHSPPDQVDECFRSLEGLMQSKRELAHWLGGRSDARLRTPETCAEEINTAYKDQIPEMSAACTTTRFGQLSGGDQQAVSGLFEPPLHGPILANASLDYVFGELKKSVSRGFLEQCAGKVPESLAAGSATPPPTVSPAAEAGCFKSLQKQMRVKSDLANWLRVPKNRRHRTPEGCEKQLAATYRKDAALRFFGA